MLSKYLLRNQPLLVSSNRMFFASSSSSSAAAAITPLEKDYYTILGVNATATPEQIKEAYRTLAKRFHPDVRVSSPKEVHEPNPDKFRDVAEAYAVLSVRESRVNYDLSRKKNPELYKGMSKRDEEMTFRRDLRDKSGQVPAAAPEAGTYAEERLAQLKKEREKYNANFLGYYRGGLPQKDAGPQRGTSMGFPGDFHSPQAHNFINYNHQDTAVLGQEEAIKFKVWMGADQVDFQRTVPTHPMYYDRNLNFMRDRSFFLSLLVGMLALNWFYKKYVAEKERYLRTQRLGNLNDIPAHHVYNHGGVLVQKEFVGLEKYHQNAEATLDWYKRAFPAAFDKKAE